ncbi:MAG TPA: penicillin acylase family protein [Acidimicrobiales bacterium]|nr:penicillin acylase family protein [Acidimicrobiales bacterium]
MTEPTRIIRDVDGIAHVRAASVLAAFEGQGFAASEDRIWQMELDRRRALGTLAEVVGPSAVAVDTFHRRMGLATHARASLDALDDETRAVLDAYAAGVNRGLDSDADLPPELVALGVVLAPWEAWHSIALYEVRHLAMGTYETKLWRSGLVHRLGAEAVARLWPTTDEVLVDPTAPDAPVPIDVAAALPAGEGLLSRFSLADVGGTGEHGSNNLVIGPSLTATGRPILAGDPHRAIDLPNVYWQNHLTCTDPDDPLDVIGLSFPGVPGFPHFGHNADVAWCITHGMADDQDLSVVDLRRTGDGVEHHRADGWHAADVRTEEVAVAGGDGIEVECVTTPAGPVVASLERDGTWTGIALRWTATAAVDTTAAALLPMVRACSVDDLDRAFEPWVVPVNNVLMADTAGAIAYRMRGRVAVRAASSGWTVVDGADPATAWEGFVPDADLPRWRDPDRGFLVTSNNRIAADGPYVSHDWAHPTRARRITELLAGRDGWSVDDVGALLGDTHSGVAAVLARRLGALSPSHPMEVRALALLDGWDHHMDVASSAAAVVGTVRGELLGLLVHELGLADDRLPGVSGPSLHQTMRFANARLAWWIDDPGLVRDRTLSSALRLAVRQLELTQGPDPSRWRWGAAHLARWAHPLLALRPDLADQVVVPPTVELGGDNECVWATSTAPPSTEASNGQVARYVFDVGDWDRSRWIVPHGVSGDSRSAHHLDQLEDWAGMRLRPMRWSADVVDAATESVTALP